MEFSSVNFILIIFVVFLVVYILLKISSKNHNAPKIEGRVCPCCGKTEFALGKQVGLSSIFSVKKPLTKGSHVVHVICLSCGSIDESYVEKPHNFR